MTPPSRNGRGNVMRNRSQPAPDRLVSATRWITSPSSLYALPYIAPHSRTAFPHDGVEDGLQIGRRLANHTKDLARGGLRVQCRRQLAIARLQLAEQPHVLDRDHRLVGEDLEKGNLLGREGNDLCPPESDRAKR